MVNSIVAISYTLHASKHPPITFFYTNYIISTSYKILVEGYFKYWQEYNSDKNNKMQFTFSCLFTQNLAAVR